MSKKVIFVLFFLGVPLWLYSFDFSFGIKYTFISQKDLEIKDEISNYPYEDIIIDETFNLTAGYIGPYITFIFGDKINLYISGNLGFSVHGKAGGTDADIDFDGVLTDSELGILYKKYLSAGWEIQTGPGIHYGWATINDVADIGNNLGAGLICIISKRKSKNLAFSTTGSFFYNIVNNVDPDHNVIKDSGKGFNCSVSSGLTF